MKLKVIDTPDNIQTVIEALKASPLVSEVKHTDISFRAAGYKFGSALLFITFKKTVTNTVPTSVWSRQKRTKTVDGKKKRATDGYVYLMETEAAGVYKIGKTINPKSRKATFGVKLPFYHDFAHVIHCDDMAWLEKALHKKFEGQKVRGEFYQLSISDVQWIKDLGTECTKSAYVHLFVKEESNA